jgi:hypothetical protein
MADVELVLLHDDGLIPRPASHPSPTCQPWVPSVQRAADSIPLLAGSALIHNLLNDECFVCEHHIRGSAGLKCFRIALEAENREELQHELIKH